MQPVRFGKYLLFDKIATGGMAELYRAKMTGDEGFEKLIAVKKILPHLALEKELVDSFIDEAKLAAHLQHENIIRIYDFGTMEHDYFIAMEYLFGKNLRMVMDAAARREGTLPLEHVLFVIGRVCDGLDYSHDLTDLSGRPLKIIHRDISPPNVFLTYDGVVKIVDFGVAKAASKNTTTQSGIIKGKLAYMSPEQARGEEIDHRSDIFSVGILLYEMVTGERMFTGETMQVLAKVREADFIPAEELKPGLAPEIAALLKKALAPDRNERYQSCGEMLADVEECSYALNLRGSARSLAHYMQALFSELIGEEEKTKRQVIQTEAVKEAPGGTAEADDEADAEADEATTVRSVEQSRSDPTLFSDQEFAREYRRESKHRGIRWAAFGGAVLLVLAAAAAVFLFLSRSRAQAPWKAAQEALDRGNYGRAVALFDAAAAAQPKEAAPYSFNRVRAVLEEAKIRADKKDAAGALALLEKAAALDPGNAEIRFRMGKIHLLKNDMKKAEAEFALVVKMNPRFAQALFNLGYIAAVTGDYPRAEAWFDRAARLSPSFLDEVLANLAAVQVKMGKTRQAVSNMERAVAVNPRNDKAREYLEWLKSQATQG